MNRIMCVVFLVALLAGTAPTPAQHVYYAPAVPQYAHSGLVAHYRCAPRAWYGPGACYGIGNFYGYVGNPRFTYSSVYYGPRRYWYVPRRLYYGAHIEASSRGYRYGSHYPRYHRPVGVPRVTARPGNVTRTFRATRR